MKKYLMALILGFAVLTMTSSCEDSTMDEIELEGNGQDKVKRPD